MPARLKSHRTKKSSRKRLRLALVLILFFVLCSLFYVLAASWRARLWVSGTRITVVVAGQDPKVYSYDPQTGKVAYFVIPGAVQLKTAGEYGSWPAQSLWDLGHQEKMEGNLLRLSVQKSLGIPVDAWISSKGETMFDSHPLGWLSAFWKALFVKDVKTNLTYFDRANLLAKISGVGTADRQKIDLVSMGVLSKTRFADGAEGYIVIPEQARVSLTFLRDDLVAGEAKRVEVVNASVKSGLAGEVASVVSTLGVRVVGTRTENSARGGCEVKGSKKELESLSARRIAKILDCETRETDSLGKSFADLEIVLGEDFARRF